MRSSIRLLLMLLPVLVAAACGSGDGDDVRDPCRGVICQEGEDCRKGVCVERVEPEPGECQSNQDCQHMPAGKLCDLENGECVQCLRSSHCTDGRECSFGVCVGSVCSSDGDCGGETPFCNDAGDACVGCQNDGQCGDGESCDGERCVAIPLSCEEHEDCAAVSVDRPWCAIEGERSFCVECLESAQCAEGWECRGGSCVDTRCVSEDDCVAFPDLPMCTPEGSCVACLENSDCEGAALCVEQRCEKPFVCLEDRDCTGRPEGEACEKSTGSCVACVADSHCEVGASCQGGLCQPTSCVDVGDCPVGSRCEAEGCLPTGSCSSDDGCAFDPRAPRCDEGGSCVACVEDVDCGSELRCVAGSCLMAQDCSTDAECGGGLSCTNGLCRSCRSDEQCPRGSCLAGSCTDRQMCSSDGDCLSGSCRSGACVDCSADLDCAQGLWCNAGSCVEETSCSTTADCAVGKECQGGTCAPSGCVNDGAEPDGDFATASGLALGRSLQRTLCPNDEDWFVFTEAEGAGILAELPSAPAGTRLSFVWFEEGSRNRREMDAPEHRLLIRSLPKAAAGRYFLRVRSVDGAAGAYQVRIQSGIGSGCTDILEPNNNREAPRRVQAGIFYGDLAYCGEDFYVVSPTAGKPLRINVFGPGSPTIDVFDAVSSSRLVADREDTPLLGGGKVAVISAARHQGRDLLIRLFNAPLAGSSYAMYLGSDVAESCEDAPILIADGGDRGRIEGTTLAAASNPRRGVCGAVGPDATWKVEIDRPSRLVVTARSAHPIRIALDGESCGGVMSCRPVPASTTGILDVPRLEPGVYVVVVANTDQVAGRYEVSAQLLSPVAPAAHDLCSGAVEIPLVSGIGEIRGSTLGAGRGSVACAPMLPTVFYSVDALDSDLLAIDLVATGPAMVSLMGDQCQGQVECWGASGAHHFKGRISPGVQSIAVASATGEVIDFTLKVERGRSSTNDRCEDAAPLTLPAQLERNTRWAENQLSFPLAQSCTGYWLDGNDEFYSVTLAAGQSITATLTPEAGYDGALVLTQGCSAPMCLAGADQAPRGGVETLRFTAATAGTYLLVVDGASGGGRYQLRVE